MSLCNKTRGGGGLFITSSPIWAKICGVIQSLLLPIMTRPQKEYFFLQISKIIWFVEKGIRGGGVYHCGPSIEADRLICSLFSLVPFRSIQIGTPTVQSPIPPDLSPTFTRTHCDSGLGHKCSAYVIFVIVLFFFREALKKRRPPPSVLLGIKNLNFALIQK